MKLNYRISLVAILVASLSFTSCGSKKEKLSKKIDELEAVEILDAEQKKELADAYFAYGNIAVDDSISRPYIANAVSLNMELERYDEVLANCDTFISRYPKTYEAQVFLFNSSQAHQGLGDPAKGIELMKKYHEVKPRLTPEELTHFGVLYQQYVEKFPNDSLSLDYQLELANTMSALGNKKGAVQQFQAFYTAYPEAEAAPYTMMQAADISDKHLGDTAQARSILMELIEKHPDHTFGLEAKTIIEKGYIGKSNAEILQDIIKNRSGA